MRSNHILNQMILQALLATMHLLPVELLHNIIGQIIHVSAVLSPCYDVLVHAANELVPIIFKQHLLLTVGQQHFASQDGRELPDLTDDVGDPFGPVVCVVGDF